MRRRRRGHIERRAEQITWDKALTDAEQKRIHDYLRGDVASARTQRFVKPESIHSRKFGLMIELLMHTGLRITELVSLRLQDTPAGLGVPAIKVYMGKFGKDRMVPVSRRLVREIEDYVRTIRPKTMPRWMRRKNGARPVFLSRIRKPYYRTNRQGRRCTSSSVYRMIRRLGEDAGFKLKRLHPHIFRHTFAVNTLRQRGITINDLKRLMGHSSITITDRYLELAGFDEGVGEALDVAFPGGFRS